MSNASRARSPVAPIVAIAALFLTALSTDRATAFKLGGHAQILQQSVGQRVATSTFADILGAFEGGQGNLGSDLHQFDDYRHFDNAPDRQTVCARATAAWSRFYAEIRDSVQPRNAPNYDQIGGISQARAAFGALTHALQDFYSHSNWLELHVAAGQSPPLATSLFSNCVASSLPPALQTGFFDLAHGLTGCPTSGPNNAWTPPPGFTYCHETLNKDSNQTLRGRELIPGTTKTYFALAAELATAHTNLLYDTVVNNLTTDWRSAFPIVRAECLVGRVMVVDVAEPCRFARLNVVNDSHNGGTRLAEGTVTIRDAAGATVLTKPITKGSWPISTVDVPRCLRGLTVVWQFYVDDALITPVARQASGTTFFGSVGCDAEVHVVPETQLRYLVRFTNADTVIASYTRVIVTVNNGQLLVPAGPVVAGGAIWIDLAPCNTVVNLDYTIEFIDPIDKRTPRTASPDPPPFPAQPGCLESFSINLGAQIYGP